MKRVSLSIQVRQAKLGRTDSGRSYIVKKSTYDTNTSAPTRFRCERARRGKGGGVLRKFCKGTWEDCE